MWIIEYLQEFNTVSVIVRVVLAMLCGGLIGLERGKLGRAAGMRTHILVCIGAALTIMLGLYSTEVLGFSTDPMRIPAQVVSGIGFLGVGTILIKGRFQITGLTTAACVWTTAIIGLAFGAGFYLGGLLVFAISFLTITVMQKVEYKLGKHQRRYGLYVEINSESHIRTTIDLLEKTYLASGLQVTPARSGLPTNIGIEANINNKKNQLPISTLSKELEELDFVVFAIESV